MATQPVSPPEFRILSVSDDRSGISTAARSAPPGYRGWAMMNGFITSTEKDAPQATVITTSGVGTCLIAVVHCIDGTGALGHIAATETPQSITNCVRQMIETLSPSKVACVVLAGGDAVTSEKRAQAVEKIKTLGVDDVKWIQEPQSGFDSAFYFPKQAKLALFANDDSNRETPVDMGTKMRHWMYSGSNAIDKGYKCWVV